MKVKFVGAIDGVTGSCSWLKHEASNTQLLVDCGMHQGTHDTQFKNHERFPFRPAEIKYVLLTHAHIDHCGLLPRLVKEGFRGHVYCTSATRDVAKLLLADSARQQNNDYKQHHVDQIKWHAIDQDDFSWRKMLRLADGLSVNFMRSSHVLGAAMVSVAWQTSETDGSGKPLLKSICFSGDIGCQDKTNCYLPLMKDGFEPFPNADYLVVESTYGATVRNPEHKVAQNRLAALSDAVERTVFGKGGKIFIPSFSFHRAQEIITDFIWLAEEEASEIEPMFHERRPLRVALHSALATKLCKVFGKYLSARISSGKYQYLNNELPERIGMNGDQLAKVFTELGAGRKVALPGLEVEPVSGGSQDGDRASDWADVIIASAGMCDHGPAKHHLEELGKDSKNTLITTGFMSAGSAGKRFISKALDPMSDHTGADVVEMSHYYSAHGDQTKLLDHIFNLEGYTASMRETVIFINHGEDNGKTAFKEAIANRAREIKPNDRRISEIQLANGQWFNLDTGRYEDGPRPEEELKKAMLEKGLSADDVKKLIEHVS
ncbi:MBL fold metallo-hydrolase [Marinobacter flavimaris]|uniref:MBL fold metallo-hydrolase n=1 Tax=Marinobacter flavimaris TaxID=262076 RepID=A0A3D8GXY6_9GAMM|nr:MBL fold metallo-hydrolase [Marinobacter flavimaris]PPI78739.1 hypothetical protein MDHKLMBL_18830 [Marinobacter flavimaris]RDU39304.1 MBL fold metallo-hydrolase [Marinobacter flavimaris]